MESDIYQERYLAHQERKANILTNNYGTKKFKMYTRSDREALLEVMKNRCSQRAFNKEEIDLDFIYEAIELAPSSCDRKGVSVVPIVERDKKDLLSGLLVGGVGWISRASTILLLVANMDAYKSPAERDFMPYLDAGVLIETVYLAAEVSNLGCCYVNPNVRLENQKFFKDSFSIGDTELFCGALAIGRYDKKHKK